jgi:hypothetical protein
MSQLTAFLASINAFERDMVAPVLASNVFGGVTDQVISSAAEAVEFQVHMFLCLLHTPPALHSFDPSITQYILCIASIRSIYSLLPDRSFRFLGGRA